MKEKSAHEISHIFHSKFPEELIQDPKYMEIFNQLGRRLDYTRESLKHVRLVAIQCINKFLNAPVSNGKPNSLKLRERVKNLNDYVFQLPKNVAIREHLIKQGYYPDLWLRDHYIQVEVDDKKNVEENFRLALIGCLGEYVDILKTLGVSSVNVNSF
jgi:hypothetical protein